MCDCLCVGMHVRPSVCMCKFFCFFFPGRNVWMRVYLFRSLCACVFVFDSSNVSEILQSCFIQWEVRGSSTNSSPNVLNVLFWSDGCRASCSLRRRRHRHRCSRHRHNSTAPSCHSAPHSPACLSQQPTNSLPSHHPPHCHHGNCVHTHIQSVLEVRWGYSTERRVNCCSSSDSVQKQKKC